MAIEVLGVGICFLDYVRAVADLELARHALGLIWH